MSKEDFLAWVQMHTSMFGMSADDIAMVVSWRSALDDYSLHELKAASVELLKLAPSYRNEHVSGLFRILGKKRAVQTKAFAAQRDDEYTGKRCPLCQSTGFTIVPHPACVKDGEFVVGPGGYKATTAVMCSCHVGARKLSSFDKAERRPHSLQSYEMSVTTAWREMLEADAEERKQRAGIREVAAREDARKGKLQRNTA